MIMKTDASAKQNIYNKYMQPLPFKEIITNKQMDFLLLVSMMKSLITNSTCILLPFLWKDMGYPPFYIGSALFLFVFAGALGSFISPKIEKMFG